MRSLCSRLLLAAILLVSFVAFATSKASPEEDASFSSPVEGAIAEEVDKQFEQLKSSGKTEVHQFETEVNRMMNIIVNSLYKTKEIFLREVISNAADALDKIRFLSLTDSKRLGSKSNLKITVVPDKKSRTLTITDTGVGMTRDDLVKNLGTIAKSGTSDFAKNLANSTDKPDLIGQFGVGFYSVFLVATRVVVVSKHDDDEQYIWESDAKNGYSLVKDPRGDTLGRGTSIILYLKEDADEYLDDANLRKLLTKYSQFVRFPIYLWEVKTVKEKVPVEKIVKETEDSKESEVEDVDDTAAEAKETFKEVEKNVTEFSLVNEHKPLWMREPSEISESEYFDFYKALFKETKDPIAYTHFKAEGDSEFRALCFVPATSPNDYFQNDAAIKHNIRLFVKRVFISDDLSDYLPKYLAFVKCIIDADDISLNVSRETIQQTALLQLIRRKLISKILELLRDMAENKPAKYEELWKEYALQIKYGVIDDAKNRQKIVELLRFATSKDSSGHRSLQRYTEDMKKKQPQIYYLTGGSVKEIESSPFVEQVLRRGYEVIYMKDPIDEYLLNSLTEYEKKPLQNVAKEGLILNQKKSEKELLAKYEKEFEPLKTKLKEWLSEYLDKVVISTRLVSSPCAVVAPTVGWTGQTEKLMRAQALNKGDDYFYRFQEILKKVLEINPRHPLIKALLEGAKRNDTQEESTLKNNARVLYEVTALKSGYSLKDVNSFAERVESVVSTNLNIPANAKVEDAPVAPEDEEDEVADNDEDEGPTVNKDREELDDEEFPNDEL